MDVFHQKKRCFIRNPQVFHQKHTGVDPDQPIPECSEIDVFHQKSTGFSSEIHRCCPRPTSTWVFWDRRRGWPWCPKPWWTIGTQWRPCVWWDSTWPSARYWGGRPATATPSLSPGPTLWWCGLQHRCTEKQCRQKSHTSRTKYSLFMFWTGKVMQNSWTRINQEYTVSWKPFSPSPSRAHTHTHTHTQTHTNSPLHTHTLSWKSISFQKYRHRSIPIHATSHKFYQFLQTHRHTK